MVFVKIKEFGLVMFLVASLLTATPASCTCGPHEGLAKSEIDHHSHHDSEPHSHHDADDAVLATASITGTSCVCVVEQRTSCVSSKLESKDLKGKTPLFYRKPLITDFEIAAVLKTNSASPTVATHLAYSSAHRSLLPARAPPRL